MFEWEQNFSTQTDRYDGAFRSFTNAPKMADYE
jgi:hypothetical protein